MQWFLVLLSLFLLFFGGDFLVRGTVGLSNKLNICKVVISTIIAGFATSMPEFVVCIQAAYKGTTDLVVGNIVGSNIANTFLILGVGWILYPKIPEIIKLKKDIIWHLIIIVLFVLITFFNEINFYLSVLLFIPIGIYLYISYKDVKNKKANVDLDLDDVLEKSNNYKMPVFYILSGISLLIIGAKILVDNSVSIARYYNISESVIGLSLIAVGTSIPELATTVVASIRKESSMIIGNVIGSNIFNVSAVLGFTGIIFPLNISQNIILIDRWVLLISAVFLSAAVVFVNKKTLIRVTGSFFLSFYFFYMIFLFV